MHRTAEQRMESDPDLTRLQTLPAYRRVLNFVGASDTDQKETGTEVPRAEQSAGVAQGLTPRIVLSPYRRRFVLRLQAENEVMPD